MFIKKSYSGFAIVAIYVDDMNLNGTPKRLGNCLTPEAGFEIKDKAKPLSTLMIVRILDVQRDQLCPKNDNEEVLKPKVSYLNAICALLYLAQCTIPDISFAMNLLSKYSNTHTSKHWTCIKRHHVLP